MWAYVDVRDVADAVVRCLEVEGIVHDCFLLAADDTSAHVPTAELVAPITIQTNGKMQNREKIVSSRYTSTVPPSTASP